MAKIIEFSTESGTPGVEFYAKGNSGASRVVGVESGQPRVVRYTFTAPAEGGYGISVKFYCTEGLKGSAGVPLRFFIGTDPESHKMGGAELEYSGILNDTEDQVGSVLTGTAPNVLLLPGKTYYLWVFPGTDSTELRYYSWYRRPYETVRNTITLINGAGVIHVGKADGSCELYQIYVGNSSGGADLRIPYAGRADGGADLIS